MRPTEDKEALLTDAEIQAKAQQAFKEDALLRHYVESRGHWEEVAPIIAKEQLAKMERLGYHRDPPYKVIKLLLSPEVNGEFGRKLQEIYKESGQNSSKE